MAAGGLLVPLRRLRLLGEACCCRKAPGHMRNGLPHSADMRVVSMMSKEMLLCKHVSHHGPQGMHEASV